MSLTLLNKKYQALMLREKQIEDHFDPVVRHKKQHHNIEDLRQDYQEDLENYGFSKQSFKAKKEQELENIQITPEKSLRPMTALISPVQSSSQRQRPITAPGLNTQTKQMMKIDENEEMLQLPYHSETKYWRNTKKYDKTNQNVVRNHSALKKVSLGGDCENYNIEEQEIKNHNLIEKQIIKNRLLSPTFVSQRHQINDRDVQQLTEGFYQHVALIKGTSKNQSHNNKPQPGFQLYDNLLDLMKLINQENSNKSPIITKTSSQGFRPQTGVSRQIKSQQHTRPFSSKIQTVGVRAFQQ
ncbi:unnamed protein product [Paramecium octaurelia]|uniref:Uncharacterized protein n=1 Tax=Paramecium octaurelia TaxID=43137 RepID=A0A8S1WPB9_PAROT|nr:unnamed protein product [Paramecium octaurelia]